MDNLVSVYKSMEVASGVSIFITQTEASTKPSGNDLLLCWVMFRARQISSSPSESECYSNLHFGQLVTVLYPAVD